MEPFHPKLPAFDLKKIEEYLKKLKKSAAATLGNN